MGQFQEAEVPWYPLFSTLGCLRCPGWPISSSRVREIALLRIANAKNAKYAIMCLFCILLVENRDFKRSYFGKALRALLNRRGEADQHRSDEEVGWELIDDLVQRLVFDKKRRVLNLSAMPTFFCESFRAYCLFEEWIVGETIKGEELRMPDRVEVADEDWDAIIEFVGGDKPKAKSSAHGRPGRP